MKTLRMIGMAVVAILMCVSLVSCSDDDGDEDYAEMIVGEWYVNEYNETYSFVKGGILRWKEERWGIKADGSWSILDKQLTIKLTYRTANGISMQTKIEAIEELTSTRMVTSYKDGKEIIYTRK